MLRHQPTFGMQLRFHQDLDESPDVAPVSMDHDFAIGDHLLTVRGLVGYSTAYSFKSVNQR